MSNTNIVYEVISSQYLHIICEVDQLNKSKSQYYFVFRKFIFLIIMPIRLINFYSNRVNFNPVFVMHGQLRLNHVNLARLLVYLQYTRFDVDYLL